MKARIFIATFLTMIMVILILGIKTDLNNKKIIYLSDSIQTIKRTNGELLHSKEIYEISLKDLKNNNKELFNEIVQLKENPIIVEKTKIIYEVDTTQITTIVDTTNNLDGKTYNLNWSYISEDKLCNINGLSSLKLNNKGDILDYNTKLNNIKLDIELKSSISKDDKGRYKQNVTTSSEYVNITKLDGFIINDKKVKPKKFGISLFIGPSYNLIDKSIDVSCGIALTYDILQLF